MVGDVSASEISRMVAEINRSPLEGECIYTINDMTRMGALDGLARRTSVTAPIKWRIRGMAFLGAGFGTRVVLTFLNRAFEMITKGTRSTSIAFFDTEEQARAWIDALRRQTSAERG
jgi:hypothetical protein